MWALVTPIQSSCLSSRVLVWEGGHSHHKLSANVKMAVVVDKLEQLGVVYRLPLADATMLPKSPLWQSDAALAVVGVHLVVFA